MVVDRRLDWDGCFNVRDLGGLPTADGRETRWGAVVRSEAPDLLTADGWSALYEHGIRTIIDLRSDDELTRDAERRADLHIVRRPLDAVEDAEFWDRGTAGGQFGTPLYYRPFLDHFPHRIVGVLGVIAQARLGGVLVHRAAGRHRTGLITLLLLALVGVAAEDIADYALSVSGLARLFTLLEGPGIDAYLACAGTSAREVIISTLGSLDVDAYLRVAGLGNVDLAELRARLLGPVK
jgi:protein-tyrosine phosphatase